LKRIGLVLAVLAGVAAVLFGGLRLFAPAIGERVFARQVEIRLGRDRRSELPDGLHAAFCGTGSPLPDPTRAQSCIAVIAGERVFIVDSGSGSTANLLLMGLPAGAIEAVFLTHFHSDHLSDLGDLGLQRWIGGAHETPLPVHGPDGVTNVVDGFNTAYARDAVYRTGHHGAAIAPPSGHGLEARPFAPPAGGGAVTLIDTDGLQVRAVAVDHDPAAPAVAYRFDYGGRSLVISGDLAVPRSPGFADLARGADLLIVEALQPRLLAHITDTARARDLPDLATITTDILDYHTTPEEAADAAAAAGAQALVLTHIVPAVPAQIVEPAFLGEARARFDGLLKVARDGDAVLLPAGTQDVEVRQWR
jgi:ribonuclease Z